MKKQPKQPNKSSDRSRKFLAINFMEELVSQTLRGLLSDVPKKQRLTSRDEADIKALALNRLWPMYVTTEKGKRYVERDVVTDRIDRDVTRELRAAMDLVDRHPHN